MIQVILKLPKLLYYEEMIGTNEAPAKKETEKEANNEIKKRKDKYEIREHCFDKATKKWGKWSTSNKRKKTL